MTTFLRRRVVVPTVALVAAMATATTAYAYWSAIGSGSGAATTGTMTFQVTALAGGDTNDTTLVPGGTGDLVLRVDNTNSYAVHVSSIAGTAAPTASNGCTPTGVTFTAPTDYSAAQFTLTPGSHLIRLAGAVGMSSASASACQGAAFSVPVTVTVQR